MKVQKLFKSWHKWIKGIDAREGRPSKGHLFDAANPHSELAQCWCLRGAVRKCYPNDPQQAEVFKQLRNSIFFLFPNWSAKWGNSGLTYTASDVVVQFNDAHATKFADVLKVVKHAKV